MIVTTGPALLTRALNRRPLQLTAPGQPLFRMGGTVVSVCVESPMMYALTDRIPSSGDNRNCYGGGSLTEFNLDVGNCTMSHQFPLYLSLKSRFYSLLRYLQY